MASPQGGYPPQGYSPTDQYSQPQQPQQYDQMSQPGYEAAGSPPSSSAGQQITHAEGKKKRAYAAQAYEFGVGANAALGGQQQAGGAYSQAQTAGYSGYSQQPGYQQPGFGNDHGIPAS